MEVITSVRRKDIFLPSHFFFFFGINDQALKDPQRECKQ